MYVYYAYYAHTIYIYNRTSEESLADVLPASWVKWWTGLSHHTQGTEEMQDNAVKSWHLGLALARAFA